MVKGRRLIKDWLEWFFALLPMLVAAVLVIPTFWLLART